MGSGRGQLPLARQGVEDRHSCLSPRRACSDEDETDRQECLSSTRAVCYRAVIQTSFENSLSFGSAARADCSESNLTRTR